MSRSEDFSTQVQFLQREYIKAVPESLSLNSVIVTTRINKNIDEVIWYWNNKIKIFLLSLYVGYMLV